MNLVQTGLFQDEAHQVDGKRVEGDYYSMPKNGKFKDLTGNIYGRLTVIGYAGNHGKGAGHWTCICECKKVTQVISGKLNSGKTKSCGCLSRDMVIERSKTHGLRHTPEYKIYAGIKKRCENPNDKLFKYYGERGIKLELTFEQFFAEIGVRPSKAHQVDRINNDGNYAVNNIRWATRIEQCNNRRSNIVVVINGKSRTLAEWVGSSKTKQYKNAHHRITQDGWCHECAIFKDSCEHREGQ